VSLERERERVWREKESLERERERVWRERPTLVPLVSICRHIYMRLMT